MLEDGDAVLNLVGVVLVVGLLAAGGVVALNFTPQDDEEAPDADWSFERVNDSTIRVTHAGGDPVREEPLRVTVDGVGRSTTWDDPVVPNDSALVQAPEGTMVRVVWQGGRANRAVMATERV